MKDAATPKPQSQNAQNQNARNQKAQNQKAQNWFTPEDGDLDGFIASLGDATARDPAQTQAQDCPLATTVTQGVPVYSGDAIRAQDDPMPTLSEWANVLLDGPGIIVIKAALPDHDVIDRATAVFDQIITSQRDTDAGGGDHFAKPGANDRVWSALQKHCLADPEGFALYYGNVCLDRAALAWLGPDYQVTAQVNRVNPGGAAQSPHRDYHLGFMSTQAAARWPQHVHRLSPALTLQGAVAHCDMPVESGPTCYLPHSQKYGPGYLCFSRPEFQDYFAQYHVQLPLEKGDAVFFNPALMHGAGANRSPDIYRMANLLQISSAFGRAMENMDRMAMSLALYPALQSLAHRLSPDEIDAAIAACAEGYAFPTNLDTDPPVGGLAPISQASILRNALEAKQTPAECADALQAWHTRRSA